MGVFGGGLILIGFALQSAQYWRSCSTSGFVLSPRDRYVQTLRPTQVFPPIILPVFTRLSRFAQSCY